MCLCVYLSLCRCVCARVGVYMCPCVSACVWLPSEMLPPPPDPPTPAGFSKVTLELLFSVLPLFPVHDSPERHESLQFCYLPLLFSCSFSFSLSLSFRVTPTRTHNTRRCSCWYPHTLQGRGVSGCRCQNQPGAGVCVCVRHV